MKRIFQQAIQEAGQLNRNYVALKHLLLAISSSQNDGVVDTLRKLYIDPEEVRWKTLDAVKEQIAVPFSISGLNALKA